ncbi:MAG: flagellar hook-basal body protein [Thermosulfidibacteraceae bacterium]
MVSSLYVGASGMIVEERRLAVISNNLANVNTNGFKRDEVTFKDYLYHSGVGLTLTSGGVVKNRFFREWFDPQNSVVYPQKTYTSFLAGSVEETGLPTNVTIDGDGFLTVSFRGGVYYTRDGSFKVYPDGTIRNSVGALLMGRKNTGAPLEEVRVDPNSDVYITSDGWLYSNGARVYKLEIVTFGSNPNNYIEKAGSNLFKLKNPTNTGQTVDNPSLLIGYIEKSNSDPVMEMVKLVDCFRHYEACQRVVVSTFEDVTAKTVNDVGKVG